MSAQSTSLLGYGLYFIDVLACLLFCITLALIGARFGQERTVAVDLPEMKPADASGTALAAPSITVRSLAGMLHKCGLLERGNDNLLEYASKLYNTKGNDAIAQGFKDTFSRSCPVYFIGVWDTVESLAMNAKKKFHDARLNPEVRFGYQAISIDERRKDFKPSLWDDANIPQNQTMEQMWFAGVHSDVGGWYDERGLSNIALRWMLKKAKDAGMQVDEVAAAGYVADPHGEIHESYSGFWKIRRSYRRKIPEGALIHPSVDERIKKASNKYAPKNLPANYHVVD